MPPIRTLVPPGGFSNRVGYYVAALDMGLQAIKAAAHRASDDPAAAHVLQRVGALERAWIHEAVGEVPTPSEPDGDAGVDAWVAWLDAVRTISLMVLRPLVDRDLERLVEVDAATEEAENAGGPRTLKRLLSELLFRQGSLHGAL